MSAALVFSPSLSGHRPVYCQVIADVLHGAGKPVVVAGALRDMPASRRDSFVEKLRRHGPVHLVDTSRMSRGGREVTLAQMARLVRDAGADLTVLTEADDHVRTLVRQIGPGGRLPGRRVGLFLRTTRYFHIGRARESRYDALRRWRHGRTRWDRDPYLFHEHLLPRFGLLDAALCLDEAFVAAHGAPHQWLPDVYASFDAEDWALDHREQVLMEQLARFKDRLGDRPLLVYYGLAQARRGYPDVLRLAEAVDGAVAHCGVLAPIAGEEAEVERLRAALTRRGALFESDGYVEGYGAARRFFAAGGGVVLPYRRHYGSSGVMLQALDAGRPVLVPNRGLMAWRVASFGLGRTAPEGSFAGLRAAFEALYGEDEAAYAPRVQAFMTSFSRDRVVAALSHAFGLGGQAVAPPSPPSGMVAA